MQALDAGDPVAPALLASQVSEILSIAVLLVAVLVLAFVSYRVKTIKSFQFEMFIFALVVTISEVAQAWGTFGNSQATGIEGMATILHTASIVLLSGFIMTRVLKYFRQGR